MAKRGFLEGHGIVRNAIGKDILQFAIPAIIIFFHRVAILWTRFVRILGNHLGPGQGTTEFVHVPGSEHHWLGSFYYWINSYACRPDYTLAKLLWDRGHKGRSPIHYTRHLSLYPKSNISGSHYGLHRLACVCRK